MAQFIYKGTNKEGVAVEETVEAVDKFAVYTIARENGHTVTKVIPLQGLSFLRFLNVDKINAFLSRVKADELVMMTRNLSAMLKAGLPLSRALSVIERQSSNPRLKSIMVGIRESISKGDPFHVGLGQFPKVFPPLYIAMVRAGGESGGMVDALANIALQLERSSNLRKKVKGAMMYPAVVLSAMGIIGILMMIYVVPTLTSTFVQMGIELPTSTKIIIGTSTFFTEHGVLALFLFLFFIGACVGVSRTSWGKYGIHFLIVRLPIFGVLVRQTNAAYTARTLASLLSSGVDVISALMITENVLQNVHYKKVLRTAAASVEKGNPLSQTFVENSSLYPILVGEMILVGEETGQIAVMLGELALFYENEVEQKTKDLSTIIEPLLMVVIGGGVGFFALAMITPIYSITENI